MAVVSPEHVYKMIEQNSFSVYTVKADGNIIDMNDEKGLPSDEVIDRLRSLLSHVESGTVDISFYKLSRGEKAAGGKVMPEMSFKVATAKSESGKQSIGAVQSSADLKTLYQENFDLKLAIEKLKFENDLKDLRREIKESRSSDDDGGIVGLLKPFLPELVPLVMAGLKGPRGVAGHGSEPMTIVTAKNETVADVTDVTDISDNNNETSEDDTYTKEDQMIDEAISRLIILDPDFHNTITKLAEFASAYPDKYKQYLPLLSV